MWRSERAFKAPYRKRVSDSPHSSPAKDPVSRFCRSAMSVVLFSVALVQCPVQTHICQPFPFRLSRVDLALPMHRPTPEFGLRSRCKAYGRHDREQRRSRHYRVGRRAQSLELRHEVRPLDDRVDVRLSTPNRHHSNAGVLSANTQAHLAAVSE